MKFLSVSSQVYTPASFRPYLTVTPLFRLLIYATLHFITQEHLQGTLTPLIHAHAGRTPAIPRDFANNAKPVKLTLNTNIRLEIMKIKTKILIWLVLFAILDLIIPFPITAIVLIYVLFYKPTWFKEYVKDIYEIEES